MESAPSLDEDRAKLANEWEQATSNKLDFGNLEPIIIIMIITIMIITITIITIMIIINIINIIKINISSSHMSRVDQ